MQCIKHADTDQQLQLMLTLSIRIGESVISVILTMVCLLVTDQLVWVFEIRNHWSPGIFINKNIQCLHSLVWWIRISADAQNRSEFGASKTQSALSQHSRLMSGCQRWCNGVGNVLSTQIVPINTNQCLNATAYMNIIADHVHLFLHEHSLPYNGYFQHTW